MKPFARDAMAFVAACIAIEIVTTYCVLTGALLHWRVPAENLQLFNASMTAMVSMTTGIIGFFYGRAHEAAKNAELANARLAAATPAAQPNVAEVTAEAGKGASIPNRSPL